MPIGLSLDGVEFSASALLARPEHAAVLGRIFTSWSLIEATVGGLLGLLMHADHKAAIALLSKFKTNHSRVQAVQEVAKAMLEPTDLVGFNGLMKKTLAYAEERNKIAHGLWGVRENEPDIIYRLPLTACANFMVEIVPEAKRGNHMSPVNKMAEQKEKYSLHDLEALEKKGADILAAVMGDFITRSNTASAT